MQLRLALATVALSLAAVSMARAALVVHWNFNSSNLTASSGTGTMSVSSEFTGTGDMSFPASSGTTTNAVGADVAGVALQLQGSGSDNVLNNGGFIDVSVDLSNYINPIVTFAVQLGDGPGGNIGFNNNSFSYKVGAGSFVAVTPNLVPTTTYATATYDLSAAAHDALDNASSVVFRYTFNGASGANAANWNRIDNYQVNATLAAIPEPGAFLFGGLICGVIGIRLGGRRLLAKLRHHG